MLVILWHKKGRGILLADLIDQQLIFYPNHNKPNFSTPRCVAYFQSMVWNLKKVREVRELQLALGFVAANEGVCITPMSAQSVQLTHLTFVPILDEAAISPVFMAVRNMDESEDIRGLFDSVYQVYDLEAIPYDRAVF